MKTCGKNDLLAQAAAAAKSIAQEERPGLWDRLRCAIGRCRLRWHLYKEGPVHDGPFVTGWYRTYEGVCPICKASKLKMEKAT